METIREKNVVMLREKFLESLQRRVDEAFLNSKAVNFKVLDGGGYTAEEIIVKSNQDADKIKMGIKTGKDISLSEDDQTGTVNISNSHEFKDLLTLAYRKLGYSEQNIQTLVSGDLEHEYAHHVHILGEPGVKTEYGVTFFYDLNKDLRGMQPFVSVTGKLTLEALEKFYGGPSDPSTSDSVMNNAFSESPKPTRKHQKK